MVKDNAPGRRGGSRARCVEPKTCLSRLLAEPYTTRPANTRGLRVSGEPPVTAFSFANRRGWDTLPPTRGPSSEARGGGIAVMTSFYRLAVPVTVTAFLVNSENLNRRRRNGGRLDADTVSWMVRPA